MRGLFHKATFRILVFALFVVFEPLGAKGF